MVLSPGKRANIKVPGKPEHLPKKSPTGLCKIQRGAKPLRDKRFYLDIKNHCAASKLENTLRALGAVVDPFLGQEVNIVVTDRPEWGSIVSQSGVGSPSCPSSTSSLPKPSPCLFSPAASPAGHSRGSNNSPAFDSPGEATGTTRRLSRSRAEAMLDRVRQQPQVKVRDPLTDAHKWNIPIWTYEKILKFVEKIHQSISRGGAVVPSLNKSKRAKETVLVHKVKLSSGKHFLKIEPIDRKCRPSFKDLPSWPKVNLEGDPGTPPFLARVPAAKKIVLPKTRSVIAEGKNSRVCGEVPKVCEKTVKPPAEVAILKAVREELLSGYCEVCKLDYSDLYEHIRTPNHLKFSRNNKNYAALDGFVNSRSLSVNDYLTKSVDKSEDICASGRQQNCSSEGRALASPECILAAATAAALSPLPSPPASPADAESVDKTLAKDGIMRQSVDDRHLATKMVGRKDALEVHCNGLSNHVQTRFACTKGDRENLVGEFLDERLPSAQLRRRRAISVSCRDLLQLSTATNNEHYLRSGRGTQLSPALSDNSHPLLNSNSQQPLLSPTLSEKSHHLRARGHLWLATSLLAEDEPLSRGGNGRLSSSLLVTANNCHLDKDTDDKTGDRRSIRRKRLSAEEKLIEDNRGYYKVEVLNSKLRSTGYYVSQAGAAAGAVAGAATGAAAETNGQEAETEEEEAAVREEVEAEPEMKEPVVVRFKKIRRSELSVLSDEAENFMFGDQARSETNSDSSEFEEEEDGDEDECEDGVRTQAAEEEDEEEEEEDDDEGTDKRVRPMRRIRLKVEGQGEDVSNASSSSVAPAHLTPNGHRRYRKYCRRRNKTESSTNDSEANDPPLKDDWCPTADKGDVCSVDKLHFSFESVPRSEVWFQTFERQDRCEEVCFPIPYEPSALLLPYQVGRQVGRQRAQVSSSRPKALFKKRRHKTLVKLPRKSPRCHASTLAMLSSRHPFRSSLDEVTTESNSSETASVTTSVTTSVTMSVTTGPTTRRGVAQSAMAPTRDSRTCGQVSDFASESDPDMREIAKNVDSMLGIVSEPCEESKVVGKGRLKKKVKGEVSENDRDPALNYLVDPEILEELACTCDVVANPLGGPSMDIVTLLDTYASCGCVLNHDVEASCNSSECGASSIGDTDRRMRKKRKRLNRTGWDKPKKKSLRREVLSGTTTPVPTPVTTPVPTRASSPAPESVPAAEVLQCKRKRKLRASSSPAFRKGRGGVKRLKLSAGKESPKKEAFRKRGRTLGWRKPR